MENLIGRVIKSYELRDLISSGGFGAIYRANQAVVDREVAIKIIWPVFASRENFIRRFETEAQLVASLEHPHIVPLYDYWRDPNGAYIVMRWLRGGDLRRLITRHNWTTDMLLRLMQQIAAALHFAHRSGVVHRDLKPENILLDEYSNAYLADFGIATILSADADPLDEFSSMGSLAYAAPEQISANETSPLSDQYSLGVIVFELLAGRHPFPELDQLSLTDLIKKRSESVLPSLRAVRPEMSAAIDEVIQRATALNPADRFPDVLTMMNAVQASVTANQRDVLRRAAVGTGRRDGNGSTMLTAETVNLPNPYKGLRPFQEADATRFFGRERLIRRLLGRLDEPVEFGRFLAVVGPSGSGKSSVVRAGLIPTLRQGAISQSDHWFYIDMVPGTQPFRNFEVALVSVAVTPPTNLYDQIRHDPHGLHNAILQILPDDEHSELFLFIDQFEEVFTLVDDEQVSSDFLQSLYNAVTAPDSRLRLVLTLRADFYDRPLMRPVLSELMSQRTEVVVPLTAEELERAIVAPARRVGVTPEPSLVTAIIAEVSEHVGMLPLVQYLMSELFDRRSGGHLTLADYHRMGGVRGALARRADELYKALDPAHQDAVRQLFLRLVTLGEGTEDTRRRVLLSEITALSGAGAGSFRSVIDLLGKSRLLTFDRDPETRSPTVEITHEAIIREWTRLRSWLDASRNDVRLQRNLASLTNEWLQSDRDVSYLLRDNRLHQFKQWATDTDLILTSDEQRFLQISLEEQQRRETQELQRIQHEQNLEERARLRLRILLVVLALAAVVGFSLTALALDQSRRAQRESEVSESLLQDASARRALQDGDSDLAVVLALAAADIADPAPQVQRTLAEVALAPGTRHRIAAHESSVTNVDISPDGRRVVSASRDGTLRLWDTQTGELLQTFEGHRGDVEGVAFSPDGQYIASGSLDFTAILWDVASGQPVRMFEGHTAPIRSVAFSAEGDRLLTAGSRDTLIEWDVATGEIYHRLDGHQPASVDTVTTSPDNRFALSGGGNGMIILWDIVTGEEVYRLTEHTTTVNDIDFNVDGTLAISASGDGTVMLWDVATGAVRWRAAVTSDVVLSVEFNNAQPLAVVGTRDGTIQFIDLASGRSVNTLVGHSDEVTSVAVSDDGRVGASGAVDQTLRLWNLIDQTELGDYVGHTGRISGLHVNAAGDRLYTASFDGTVRVWDALTRAELQVFDVGPIDDDTLVRALAVSPDETLLLAGRSNGEIEAWDLRAQSQTAVYTLHQNPIRTLTFSPDGAQVLSTAQGEPMLLWDIATQTVIQRFDAPGALFSVAFSPDGEHIAYGADDNTLIIRDVTGQAEAVRLSGHTDSVRAVAFSPDGTRLLSGSRDATVRVWDVAAGRQQLVLNGHADAIWAVTFNADGSTALSSANDGEIIWWDLGEGEALQRFRGSIAPVLHVAFIPGGDAIILGGDRGVVEQLRIFSLDELVEWTRQNRYLRELGCQERTVYRVEPYC